MARWRSGWLKLAVAGVGVAAALAGGLYYRQDMLLYHPVVPGMPTRTADNPHQFRTPTPWGMHYREKYVTTADGERLHTWVMTRDLHGSRSAKPTVVFFHGNAAST